MRRLKIVVICLALLLAVIGIAGFLIAPPLVKSLLADKLSKALRRPVTVQAVGINPYLLTATIRGFEIREPSGQEKFLSFDELFVNIDTLSAFKRALILKEIRLSGPYARIVRNADGTYNFSDLLAGLAAPEKDPQKKETPFHFSLNNIRIAGGGLDFLDGPKKTAHTVRELTVSVPFIANMDYLVDRRTQPMLSAKINGNPYVIKGSTKPFHASLETTLDVDIRDVDIPFYLAYVPFDMNFKLLSGTLDARLQISFLQQRDKSPYLSVKGDVGLKKIAVDDRKGLPIVRIPSLNIAIANIEPLAPLVRLEKVALSAPELHVRRGKQGEINLLSLLPSDRPQTGTPGAEPAKADRKAPAPLTVDVGEFRVDAGKVTFRDDQPSDAVSLVLSGLHVKMTDVSTRKGAKSSLELSAELGRHGRIAAGGPFVVDPLSADLDVDLKRIEIRPLQGYFTDRVRIAVSGGTVTVGGRAGLRDLGEKGLSATFAGRCLISDFASEDKRNSDEFLRWKSLFFSDVRAGYNPLSVHIGRIALADFYAGVVIDENGVLNLQNVFAQQEPPVREGPEAAAQAAPVPAAKEPVAKEKAEERPAAEQPAAPGKQSPDMIKIDAIVVQGGSIDFLDRFVKPNFSAGFSELGGRVSGLSSIGEKPAEVELRGKYNRHMPAEITGAIHPLRENPFVDLKAAFRDMDLSSVSPYSAKYVGHTIQKGKLSFDLKYLIVDRKLESENKIFIDQLTLGEPVDSPSATKLPIGLAIALLKDRRGQINLDVPVTGSLDDPEFSLGRLIIQVLVNLITRAVTAPFALMGSLFGGGEELGHIEFEYGLSALSETGLKKIGTLAKALYERPALKLDIAGYADMERDREGLKRVQIDRKVRALKFNDMVKRNLPVASVEDVRIEPQEYEKYLTQAYRAEPFPKPRTAIGLVKTLPVDEMEKLMLTHAVIREDDLRLLAARRAAVVRDAFLKTGQVESERIFMIEPKSPAPEKKEKLRDSRVEFKLK